MHSYLIIGNEADVQGHVDKLIKNLGVSFLEFPLKKIGDVRQLNSFTSKSFAKKTAIVIKKIDSASAATLNAFLKNLEEPQENIYYILTATSNHNLLPTVVSRCQIIHIKSKEKLQKERASLISSFLQMRLAEKLLFVKKIKDREEAKKFTDELAIKLHEYLIEKSSDAAKTAKRLRAAQKIAKRLTANTNVALQLGNLVISLV